MEKYVNAKAVAVGMVLAWNLAKRGKTYFNGNRYLAGMLDIALNAIDRDNPQD